MNSPRTRHVALNPITFLGAALAATGNFALIFLLGTQIFQVETNPYLGMLVWTGVPSLFALGLILIPAGMLWERRRQAAAARRGERIPVALKLDFGNARHLIGLAAFAMLTLVFTALVAAGGFRAAHFMDSPTFCGGMCHAVMEPQYEPYKRSAHAEVECTQCHIGPGASWYAQAKLSGLRQVVAVLSGSYPRPIPAPIENLRPARATCEGCHWREKAYGLFLKVYRSVVPDEENTVHARALAFRVGTGGSYLEEAGGVHWHTSAELWYRSADSERQVIASAKVVKPDGTEEWVNPDLSLREPLEEERLMDCIDCHNRAAHRIPPPGDLIDEAFLAGRLDSDLPYLKREALELLGVYGSVPNSAEELAARWSQDGWFEQLEDFYNVNYPEIAASKQASIREAIDELEHISELVLYPHMRTSWLTYPDNRGHPISEGEFNTGCFRCHAKLVNVETGRQLEGGLGGGQCLTCHDLGDKGEERLGGDPLDEPACSYCHVSVPLDELERPLPIE